MLFRCRAFVLWKLRLHSIEWEVWLVHLVLIRPMVLQVVVIVVQLCKFILVRMMLTWK